MDKTDLINWLESLSPDKTEKENDVTRLVDPDIYEISLVPKSATGEDEFLIQKQADSNETKAGDKDMSEIEKSINTKQEIEKEIDELAQRISEKRGVRLDKAKEQVLEENVDLYARYKAADQKIMSKSWDKLPD